MSVIQKMSQFALVVNAVRGGAVDQQDTPEIAAMMQHYCCHCAAGTSPAPGGEDIQKAMAQQAAMIRDQNRKQSTTQVLDEQTGSHNCQIQNREYETQDEQALKKKEEVRGSQPTQAEVSNQMVEAQKNRELIRHTCESHNTAVVDQQTRVLNVVNVSEFTEAEEAWDQDGKDSGRNNKFLDPAAQEKANAKVKSEEEGMNGWHICAVVTVVGGGALVAAVVYLSTGKKERK